MHIHYILPHAHSHSNTHTHVLLEPKCIDIYLNHQQGIHIYYIYSQFASPFQTLTQYGTQVVSCKYYFLVTQNYTSYSLSIQRTMHPQNVGCMRKKLVYFYIAIFCMFLSTRAHTHKWHKRSPFIRVAFYIFIG